MSVPAHCRLELHFCGVFPQLLIFPSLISFLLVAAATRSFPGSGLHLSFPFERDSYYLWVHPWWVAQPAFCITEFFLSFLLRLFSRMMIFAASRSCAIDWCEPPGVCTCRYHPRPVVRATPSLAVVAARDSCCDTAVLLLGASPWLFRLLPSSATPLYSPVPPWSSRFHICFNAGLS